MPINYYRIMNTVNFMCKFFVINILWLASCVSYKTKQLTIEESNNLEKCIDNFSYFFLEKEDIIRVLYFKEMEPITFSQLPNVIIGVKNEIDTCLFIDFNYTDTLIVGQSIKIIPFTELKTMDKERFLLSYAHNYINREDFMKNSLLICSINDVYFCEILNSKKANKLKEVDEITPPKKMMKLEGIQEDTLMLKNW